MRAWTQNDIDKFENRKKGIVINSTPIKAITIPREEPKPLKEMKQLLLFMKIDFVTEHKFLKDRKFRFDIAIIDKKLAIEYEGLFSEKSGHTTRGGYILNCEKYNLAVIAGWKLLRYTANNYKQFFSDINKVI